MVLLLLYFLWYLYFLEKKIKRLLFGQLVIGPPGSGKTTYCDAMFKLCKEIGRKVAIINIGKYE